MRELLTIIKAQTNQDEVSEELTNRLIAWDEDVRNGCSLAKSKEHLASLIDADLLSEEMLQTIIEILSKGQNG